MFDFIVRIIAEGGYLAVVALMALENIFPPIPSEMIMPLAGFNAARGEFNPVAVVLAGTVGSVAGTLPWYYAGRVLGKERLKRLASRYGSWLTIDSSDISHVSGFFVRHGRKAVLFGRLIPAVRTLISVPAGIADMPVVRFVGYSAVGSLIWSAGLTAAGYLLQAEYTSVARYLDPVTKAIMGLILGIYLYRLIRQRSGKR